MSSKTPVIFGEGRVVIAAINTTATTGRVELRQLAEPYKIGADVRDEDAEGPLLARLEFHNVKSLDVLLRALRRVRVYMQRTCRLCGECLDAPAQRCPPCRSLTSERTAAPRSFYGTLARYGFEAEPDEEVPHA